MPQTIKKYKVLVASPSDVRDERESMGGLIDELNLTYGNRINVVIELLKWETHSAPAISELSIQDTIDKDIGNDYDLFIGILWKKFGTPTKRYSSGTEQEFRNAYIRFKDDPRKLQILFYFKNSTPVSLSDINPNELKKVNEFKGEIGEKGVYYWEYNTIDELQKFLRIHIPKRIDELRKDTENVEHQDLNMNKIEIESVLGLKEELGIIDYQEIIEESFGNSSQALTRITEATKWIGDEINKKTSEFTDLLSGKQNIGKNIFRDFFRRTADVMNDYVSRIEPEIPIFSFNFEKGADAFSNLVAIYRSDIKADKETGISEAYHSIEILISGIKNGLNGMQSFLDSVSKLPRMAKELNKARRNMEIELEEIINKFQVAYSISLELRKQHTV